MTLVEFLTARLDDVERAARDAGGNEWLPGEVEDGWGYVDSAAQLIAAEVEPQRVQHIVWNDPRRVLAEVAAKRAIVEEHGDGSDGYHVPPFCMTCSDDENLVTLPCQTLRHLATVYADHPDYDESWRP